MSQTVLIAELVILSPTIAAFALLLHILFGPDASNRAGFRLPWRRRRGAQMIRLTPRARQRVAAQTHRSAA